jgi:ABC-type transport system substrate-binding protein
MVLTVDIGREWAIWAISTRLPHPSCRYGETGGAREPLPTAPPAPPAIGRRPDGGARSRTSSRAHAAQALRSTAWGPVSSESRRESRAPAGGDGRSRRAGAAVDSALHDAGATLDVATRLAAYEEIDTTLEAASPVTPIGYFGRTVACSATLGGAVLSQMDPFDFTAVSIE